jgi:S-formylglutathione hydrolase FrmB
MKRTVLTFLTALIVLPMVRAAGPRVLSLHEVHRIGQPPQVDGRLLLGFSKSGWGSFSLLLRNPEFFGYACSWDAPLVMDGDDYGIWSTEKHWGTKENFMRYLPTKWAEKNVGAFRKQKRLVLLGHQFFGNRWACPKDSPHTRTFHERLEELNIPHVYDNTIKAPHSWNQKWLRPAIERLARIAE